MIRGGKNGFFSITSVPFHGRNSNWNIHFTITITCTNPITDDDTGNESNYPLSLIACSVTLGGLVVSMLVTGIKVHELKPGQ
jgi:hypothetical protein